MTASRGALSFSAPRSSGPPGLHNRQRWRQTPRELSRIASGRAPCTQIFRSTSS
ncbi:hypothetical protein SGL43_06717 [Streptomyces globisporus]|uniref:Uncharacterized protein n=1 Tax=Streptomyces globisporus TaxID=1908 RepID=A0ABM9H7M2_STRGL|nr:hypothetical protein SGL43_06717 [Streptomyces globisporus]